jgi:hypothetical protein
MRGALTRVRVSDGTAVPPATAQLHQYLNFFFVPVKQVN